VEEVTLRGTWYLTYMENSSIAIFPLLVQVFISLLCCSWHAVEEGVHRSPERMLEGPPRQRSPSLENVEPTFHSSPMRTTLPCAAESGSPSSRWNLRLEAQPSGWQNLDGDIPDEELSDSYDALTNMDLAGNAIRKVKVLLLCLQWGGECIPNPCPYVYGFVLDMVQEGLSGEPYLEVDFGTHLGVQSVPRHYCEPWESLLIT
jgi:hypothetical protein